MLRLVAADVKGVVMDQGTSLSPQIKVLRGRGGKKKKIRNPRIREPRSGKLHQFKRLLPR